MKKTYFDRCSFGCRDCDAQAADGTITINGLVTDKTCDIVSSCW